MGENLPDRDFIQISAFIDPEYFKENPPFTHHKIKARGLYVPDSRQSIDDSCYFKLSVEGISLNIQCFGDIADLLDSLQEEPRPLFVEGTWERMRPGDELFETHIEIEYRDGCKVKHQLDIEASYQDLRNYYIHASKIEPLTGTKQ